MQRHLPETPARQGAPAVSVDDADALRYAVALLNALGIPILRSRLESRASQLGLHKPRFEGPAAAYGLDDGLAVVLDDTYRDAACTTELVPACKLAYDLLEGSERPVDLLAGVYRFQQDAGNELARYIHGKHPAAVLLHKEAMIHFNAGQFWPAERLLRQCLKEKPEDAASHQMLARVLLKLGRPLGERDEWGTPAWHFQLATQFAPHEPHGWVAWALATAEALGGLHIGQPRMGSLEQRDSARWLFNEGFEHCLHPSILRAWAMKEQKLEALQGIASNEFPCARALYKSLVGMSPQDSSAWYSWAIFEDEVGQNCGAETETGSARWLFRKAHEANPSDAAVLVAWARMESATRALSPPDRQRLDRAYEFLRAAERLNPSMPHVYAVWAGALRQQMRLEGRTADLMEQLISVLTKGCDVSRAIADGKGLAIHLANLFDELTKLSDNGAPSPEKLARLLDEALAADPSNEEIWSRKGWWLSTKPDSPDPRKADECFREAFKLKPSEDTVRYCATHVLANPRPGDLEWVRLVADAHRRCLWLAGQSSKPDSGKPEWTSLARQLMARLVHSSGLGLEVVTFYQDQNPNNPGGLGAHLPWRIWARADRNATVQPVAGETWVVAVRWISGKWPLLVPVLKVTSEALAGFDSSLSSRAKRALEAATELRPPDGRAADGTRP